MHEYLAAGPQLADVAVVALAILAVVCYLWGVAVSRGRRWPRYRLLVWSAGTLAAAAAVTDPLAEAADHSFTAHMVAHLLLGMVAPLLLVLAAPVTVLLRALPVPAARALARVLRSMPLQVLTGPAVAAFLNLGGLWVLYTTRLYPAMHSHPAVHVLVHIHMCVAGYLFTVAILEVDPTSHRRSYRYRTVALVAALAAHDILAKYLYAHPPVGVPAAAAETGAMAMYYGGDLVDVALIVLLCNRWYRASQPARPRNTLGPSTPAENTRQPAVTLGRRGRSAASAVGVKDGPMSTVERVRASPDSGMLAPCRRFAVQGAPRARRPPSLDRRRPGHEARPSSELPNYFDLKNSDSSGSADWV